MFTIRLCSTGNPDHGQYAPVSNPEVASAETLEALKAKVEAYIEEWNLGGGNWTEPPVKENGKTIGYFSYNLRFWTVKEQREAKAKLRAAFKPIGKPEVVNGAVVQRIELDPSITNEELEKGAK